MPDFGALRRSGGVGGWLDWTPTSQDHLLLTISCRALATRRSPAASKEYQSQSFALIINCTRYLRIWGRVEQQPIFLVICLRRPSKDILDGKISSHRRGQGGKNSAVSSDFWWKAVNKIRGAQFTSLLSIRYWDLSITGAGLIVFLKGFCITKCWQDEQSVVDDT